MHRSQPFRRVLHPLHAAAAATLLSLGACSGGSSGGGGDPGTGVDSDGDGLADGVEASGWVIVVDADGFGTDHLTERAVSSNPHSADTDGDGLDDYEEFVLRSDPQRADSDGDDLDDMDEWTRWYTNPVSVDSDGDARGPSGNATPNPALFDGLELSILKTSPSLADTDGDGRTDFDERDDPVRSPLVAEVPEFAVTFEGETTVRLNVEYAESLGETTEYGTTLTQSTTATEQNSVTSVETGHRTTTIGAEYKFGGSDGGLTLKGEFEWGREWSTQNTTSFSTETESGSEYSRMQSDSLTRTETSASGLISQGLRIRNTGTTTFELDTLALTVLQWMPGPTTDSEGGFRAVATLRPLVTGLTLAPEESTDVIQVLASDVNASLVKEFLAQPSTLHYTAGTIELVDSTGINFDFLTQNTFARTADIYLDFGGGQVERYRVATNVERGAGGTYSGITMRTALRDVLEIPYTTHESSVTPGELVLWGVRDATTIPGDGDGHLPRATWTILTSTDEQAAPGQDFEDLVLRGGESILLVYMRDEDQDGMFQIEENLHGTSDETANSDATLARPEGDGLDDFFETHTGWTVGPIVDPELPPEQSSYLVRSDPNQLDSDGDGLDDDVEMANSTDPRKADTDGDGLSDSVELEHGLPPLMRAPRLYVDQAHGMPAGPGTSWPTAFTELRDALADAEARRASPDPGDDVTEVWVAAGTYAPSDDGDHAASFRLVPLVGVYGGFLGGESKRDQRDANPVFNDCVLSGETGGDNAWHVVVVDDPELDSSAALDGFQITQGEADAEVDLHDGTGAGMLVENGSAMIFRNLFFRENRAQYGGGAVWITGGSTTFEDCLFDQNTSTEPAARGGAILVENGDLTLEGCRFTDNVTEGQGGAIFSKQLGNGLVSARDCLFLRNLTDLPNGFWGGAAILVGGRSRFENCRFLQNGLANTSKGGAIFNSQSELAVVQCTFWRNEAGYGSAIAAERLSGQGLPAVLSTRTHVLNSTFHQNYSVALYLGGTTVSTTVENSILWQNNDTILDPEEGEIYVDGSQVDVRTSCITGLLTFEGFGNTGADPQFVSPASGNLRLDSGSLCIDSGNDLVDFDPLTPGFQPPSSSDLDGRTRNVDGDGDGEAGIDMGAYEHQP